METIFDVLRYHLIGHKRRVEHRVKATKKIVGWRVYPRDGSPETINGLDEARMYAQTVNANLIKAVFAQVA